VAAPTHLDLFSGIGGFAIAAQWAGFRTVAFCELDKYCQQVLAKNFPGVPIFTDIRKLTCESVNDVTALCRLLEKLLMTKQSDCMSQDSQSGRLLGSTESPGSQCTSHSLAAALTFVLNSDTAQRIISLEAQGQVIMPKTFLRSLCEKGASFAKSNVNSVERLRFSEMAGEESKLTIQTIASHWMSCGFAKDVITNGTND
jgi:C-5 cytosine-specific DNA methylase